MKYAIPAESKTNYSLDRCNMEVMFVTHFVTNLTLLQHVTPLKTGVFIRK